MNVRPRARLRTIASAGATAVAVGSTVVLGVAAPASAATLSFDCNVPVVGMQTFSATISSNAPTTLPTGSSTAPNVTTVMTVPSSLADTMRSLLGVTSLSGVIHSTTLVNGVAKVVDLTIPSTPAGATGTAVPLEATGALAPITAGMPGSSTTLAAGAQDVVMSLVTGSGTSPFDVPCTPSTGQSTTLGTITSVTDGSRTTGRTAFSRAKHAATSTATVTSSHGIVKATGKVTFVLKRGTKKIASTTKTLSSGKAVAVFTGVRTKGKYTVTATYAGSSRLKASKGTSSFTVR
ncbi:hypothetical protein GCM10028801_35890 [Nocardioides maradonensis]